MPEQLTGNWLYLVFWAVWLAIAVHKANQLVWRLEDIRRLLIRGLK